jgi:hypothetical protein
VDQMNDPQRILVEDHIQTLEHEAAVLRAERQRDRRRVETTTAEMTAVAADVEAAEALALDVAAIGAAPIQASALIAGTTVAGNRHLDHDSTRARLGRWLVGVGTAIAGAPEDAVVPVMGAATAKATHPCDDGPTSLSHAA